MNSSQLKQYLDKMVSLMRKVHSNPNWKYGGFEELVLDCGVEMELQSRPKNIEMGLPKSCYYNCWKIVSQRQDLTYCEGYATDSEILIPLKHAWLMTREGKAIEVTWEEPGTVYFGVPFKTQWLRSLLESRASKDRVNDFSVFESNYLEGFSLLKEGLASETLKF